MSRNLSPSLDRSRATSPKISPSPLALFPVPAADEQGAMPSLRRTSSSRPAIEAHGFHDLELCRLFV
jgi:hypothetical protein